MCRNSAEPQHVTGAVLSAPTFGTFPYDFSLGTPLWGHVRLFTTLAQVDMGKALAE